MRKLLRVVLWSALLFVLSFSFGSNQAAAKEFKDVPKSHPNYAAIQEMQQKGFIGGYPDGTFKPNDPISRKHVAQLLDQALKLPKADKKLIYTDVPLNHPYYQPIMNLTQAGIVSGGNKKFNPNAPITRIQMAKMLDLGFKFNISSQGGFSDVFWDHWGLAHAAALQSNGVARGDQGYFYPNKPVTRAHYAEFLSRAMKVDVKHSTDGKVNKDEALDLSLRLPMLLEGIRIKGKMDNQTFSQIRSQLLPYATERFTDVVLKPDYPYVCFACDSFLFPYYSVEPSLRFDVDQPDAGTLKTRSILLNAQGPMSGGYFVDYLFKKESGKWKLHDFNYTKIGKKNFQLTVAEAEAILKYDYSYNTKRLKINYVSKSQASATDEKTKEKYTFDQYRFTVETDQGRETVIFDSNDGYYEVR